VERVGKERTVCVGVGKEKGEERGHKWLD